MEFLGFCILTSTFLACDAWLFLHGYNAFFFRAKTNEEKRIRNATLERHTKGGE